MIFKAIYQAAAIWLKIYLDIFFVILQQFILNIYFMSIATLYPNNKQKVFTNQSVILLLPALQLPRQPLPLRL